MQPRLGDEPQAGPLGQGDQGRVLIHREHGQEHIPGLFVGAIHARELAELFGGDREGAKELGDARQVAWGRAGRRAPLDRAAANGTGARAGARANGDASVAIDCEKRAAGRIRDRHHPER